MCHVFHNCQRAGGINTVVLYDGGSWDVVEMEIIRISSATRHIT